VLTSKSGENWTVQVFRSIGSVILGYLVFALSALAFFELSGQPPHAEASLSIMFASTLVGVVAAFVGGYLAAYVAGRKPAVHGLAVAAILAIGATVSLVSTLGHGAIWSQVAALAFMVPSATLGGWARAKRA
jgi:O-antigen/teichoic acid export membrane protein